MKYSSQQINQAWKSYLASRGAQKRQLGGAIDSGAYGKKKVEGATERLNPSVSTPDTNAMMRLWLDQNAVKPGMLSPNDMKSASNPADGMGLYALLKQRIGLNQPGNEGYQKRQKGGKIKFKNPVPTAQDSSLLQNYISQVHGAPDVIDTNEFSRDPVLTHMFKSVGQVNDLISQDYSDLPATQPKAPSLFQKLFHPSEYKKQGLEGGGKVKRKLKNKKKAEADAGAANSLTEHGQAIANASQGQRRQDGGIVDGKPGIDTNPAELKPGSFVIPKKKVDEAVADGIVKPKKANKFQAGGVPVKLTAGEAVVSPEKAASLFHMGVDLNKYAPDSQYPYTPETAHSTNANPSLIRHAYVQDSTSRYNTADSIMNNPDVDAELKEHMYRDMYDKKSKGGKIKYQGGGGVRVGAIPGADELLDNRTPAMAGKVNVDAPTQQQAQRTSTPTSKGKLTYSRSKTSLPASAEMKPDNTNNTADTTKFLPVSFGGKQHIGSGKEPSAVDRILAKSVLTTVAPPLGLLSMEYEMGKDIYKGGKDLYGKLKNVDWSGIAKSAKDKVGSLLFQQGGGVPDVNAQIMSAHPDWKQGPNGVTDAQGNPINMETGLPAVSNQPTMADRATSQANSPVPANQDATKYLNFDPNAPGSYKPAAPPSLFDQAMGAQKNYYQTEGLINTALLAGNLASKYVASPRPEAYRPDIYERNLTAEQVQANKNLDKEAATARYNDRQTGGGADPSTTANLMDKRLQIGAQFDTLRDQDRMRVAGERNQATLFNLNQSNQYNQREADRLAEFRMQKGQIAGQYTDKLQDIYKSSIEDKYKALGAQNQWNIMKADIESGNMQGINMALQAAGVTPTGDANKDKGTAQKIMKATQGDNAAKFDDFKKSLNRPVSDADIDKFMADNNIK
jgi:hypothetical protein